MSKVLFFDIDGTLVDTQAGVNEIDEKILDKFTELQEKGNYIFIATGRPFAFIDEYLLSLNFDGFIMSNGSHVMIDGKTIFENRLGELQVRKIIDFLKSKNLEYILLDSKSAYLRTEFNYMNDFYINHPIRKDRFVFDFNESVYDKAIKVETIIPLELKDEILEYINFDFNYNLYPGINVLEIFSKNITKADGINKALEYYQLSIGDSFAFGDSRNDIEMIGAVGCGVAMGNGVDELKEIADYVTDNFANDGLIKALNKFF